MILPKIKTPCSLNQPHISVFTLSNPISPFIQVFTVSGLGSPFPGVALSCPFTLWTRSLTEPSSEASRFHCMGNSRGVAEARLQEDDSPMPYVSTNAETTRRELGKEALQGQTAQDRLMVPCLLHSWTLVSPTKTVSGFSKC